MKRIWIVYVEDGIGAEMNNCITESEFYGPFTESQAKSLADKLNGIFADDPDDERKVATAMPLDCSPPRKIIAETRKAVKAYLS
jgi:hypothetical protein